MRYQSLRERHLAGEPLEDLLYESFALTREAGKRMLGQRHFDVQLIGGMVLHDGSIAEMKTGRQVCPAADLADRAERARLMRRERPPRPRQGRPPCHGQRLPRLPRRQLDEADLRPAGQAVGAIQSGMNEIDKQEAYSRRHRLRDQLGVRLDYLRDNLAVEMRAKVQRGHGFGIVDEVDNILIDEEAHAAHHLGPARAGGGPLLQVREAGADHGPGKKPETLEAKSRDWTADFDFEPSPTRSTRRWP